MEEKMWIVDIFGLTRRDVGGSNGALGVGYLGSWWTHNASPLLSRAALIKNY